MSDSDQPVIYQLKVVLLGISPLIWPRLQVKSNSTIEDLHYTLQVAMGWEDTNDRHFPASFKYLDRTKRKKEPPSV